MINIFSAFTGIIIFLELVLLVALLKPFKEPYFIRDVWCKLQENDHFSSNILMIATLSLFINAFLEVTWKKLYYYSILNSCKNSDLVWDFYFSEITICYTCFFVAVYLLLLIERVSQFLITLARMLDYELMCRHAILSKDMDSGSTKSMMLTLNKKKEASDVSIFSHRTPTQN